MPKLWRNTPGILMKTIPQVTGKRNCRCKGIIRKSICEAPQFVVRMCLPWSTVEFNWETKGPLADFKVYNVGPWTLK